MPSPGPIRKIIRATREITVIINGEPYDALLVPQNMVASVDFSMYPEDDPLKRELNIEKLSSFDLVVEDLIGGPEGPWRLKPETVRRMLESL